MRTGMTTAQRLRGILAGSAGNLLEYYDWYVYSSFTIYFAQPSSHAATRPQNC